MQIVIILDGPNTAAVLRDLAAWTNDSPSGVLHRHVAGHSAWVMAMNGPNPSIEQVILSFSDQVVTIRPTWCCPDAEQQLSVSREQCPCVVFAQHWDKNGYAVSVDGHHSPISLEATMLAPKLGIGNLVCLNHVERDLGLIVADARDQVLEAVTKWFDIGDSGGIAKIEALQNTCLKLLRDAACRTPECRQKGTPA